MLKNNLKRVFEHQSLKKVVGLNFAFLVTLSSLVPNQASFIEAENPVVVEISTPVTTQKNVQYPVEKARITQGFSFFHPGIDLATDYGTTVRPIKDGIIRAVSQSRHAYGNAIIIEHENGITSLYAHLAKIEVEDGQKITTLTKIGEIGSTGRSTGPHLHLEIRKNGSPVNPFVILPSPISFMAAKQED